MYRRKTWVALMVGACSCTGISDGFMDGFVGDTANPPDVVGVDCVPPVLEVGPAVPIDPYLGLAWVRLAPGVLPSLQLDGPPGTFQPAEVVEQRVAADGSTLTTFRPPPSFSEGQWTLWGSWPTTVQVLDPATLEIASSTTFCTEAVFATLDVAARRPGTPRALADGAWWLREGEQSPDGRLLTRLVDAGAAPGGRGLAFTLSDAGATITAQARLRTPGLPLDGCDAPDPVLDVPTDAGGEWAADTVVLTDAAGGALILHELSVGLPGGYDDTRLLLDLSAIVDLRQATDSVRELACGTWAPQAARACGPCPDDASAAACFPVRAPGLFLERPPSGGSDTPDLCPAG